MSIANNADVIALDKTYFTGSSGGLSSSAGALVVGGASPLFVQTANGTDVTNLNTATSLIGTGVGSMTIASGLWAVGRALQLRIAGKFTTVSSPLGSWTLTIKLGSTTLWSQASLSRTGSLTNAVWELTFLLVCRATGASGSIATIGQRFNFVTNTLTNSTQPVTVDISADRLLDVTLTPTNADASEHVVSQVALLTSH